MRGNFATRGVGFPKSTCSIGGLIRFFSVKSYRIIPFILLVSRTPMANRPAKLCSISLVHRMSLFHAGCCSEYADEIFKVLQAHWPSAIATLATRKPFLFLRTFASFEFPSAFNRKIFRLQTPYLVFDNRRRSQRSRYGRRRLWILRATKCSFTNH